MTIQNSGLDEIAESIKAKLANAMATHAGCLGHSKAARNEELINLYRKELEARDVVIPSDEELLRVGEFNGEGSA